MIIGYSDEKKIIKEFSTLKEAIRYENDSLFRNEDISFVEFTVKNENVRLYKNYFGIWELDRIDGKASD